MEKKTYYVSVQAGSVLENEGDTAYEFEIVATEQDVEDLMERFGMLSDADNSSAFRAHLPGVPYHQDSVHDSYDETLTDIYRKLYDLGTEETKKTITGMGSIGEQKPPVH
ncbi:hypothetical protein FE783_25535 [Paenibacillus mesophilus]|uniref:hypothetical protein n=1 Tax=Paenibacillus mesophilus TaxID=2582849 RepID=UPI00110E3C2B|nr:hypothetical protein [Paenibacillus mesophilus]TMV46674.1 hypothetical protein FE783_25535 [Paenibacillus mesophilus]